MSELDFLDILKEKILNFKVVTAEALELYANKHMIVDHIMFLAGKEATKGFHELYYKLDMPLDIRQTKAAKQLVKSLKAAGFHVEWQRVKMPYDGRDFDAWTFLVDWGVKGGGRCRREWSRGLVGETWLEGVATRTEGRGVRCKSQANALINYEI